MTTASLAHGVVLVECRVGGELVPPAECRHGICREHREELRRWREMRERESYAERLIQQQRDEREEARWAA